MHALIFASERPEDRPISRRGVAGRPQSNPASVTPEPQHRSTVPLASSGGVLAASCATSRTASLHSKPNGNIRPPFLRHTSELGYNKFQRDSREGVAPQRRAPVPRRLTAGFLPPFLLDRRQSDAFQGILYTRPLSRVRAVKRGYPNIRRAAPAFRTCLSGRPASREAYLKEVLAALRTDPRV